MSLDELVQKARSMLTRAHEVMDKATEAGEIYFDYLNNADERSDVVRYPIPFYRTFQSIAVTLEDMIYLMTHPDEGHSMQNLFNYTTALSRPQKRISLYDDHLVIVGVTDEDGRQTTYYDSSKTLDDPLILFNSEARDIVVSYARGDTLFGGTVARDHFLMHTVYKLTQSSKFSKEGLEAASDEMAEAIQHALDNLQDMYHADPEAMVKEYAQLLELIQEEVITRDPAFGQMKSSYRRRVVGLSEKAQGHFKVAKPAGGNGINSSLYIRHAYQVRGQIVSAGDPMLALVAKMAADNVKWSTFLPELVEIIRTEHAEDVDLYPMLEYEGEKLVRAEYAKVSIEDIIGQQDNVKRLGQLLYAFGEGRRIPNIVLYGPPGRGKTMSFRALAGIHPNLRVVLIDSSELNNVQQLIEKTRELPYQIVGYVDDMHFGPFFDIEEFKTTTDGVKDEWPANFTLAISVNPEAWDKLPDSLKERFGVKLDYVGKLGEEHWSEVFKVVTKHEGVEYTPELFKQFKADRRVKSWARMNGRNMRDYVREHNAVTGVEFPEAIRQATPS